MTNATKEPGQGNKRAAQWLKLSLTVPSRMVEAVSDLLAVQSDGGVELEPETEQGVRVSALFLLAPDAPSGLPTGARAALEELFALYGAQLPELETGYFADQQWRTSWQQFFRAETVAPGLVICPSWEDHVPSPGQQVIRLDPGQAFGTGQHPSTRLALQLLRQAMNTPPPTHQVLDIGTGTGILAMAAIRFGAHVALALDNDPVAVEVACSNIVLNALEDRITVSDQDLEHLAGSFDLILANIVHDVLEEMIPDFLRLLKTEGLLVLAGILAGWQEKNLRKRLEQAGMRCLASERSDEWAALLLRNSPD